MLYMKYMITFIISLVVLHRLGWHLPWHSSPPNCHVQFAFSFFSCTLKLLFGLCFFFHHFHKILGMSHQLWSFFIDFHFFSFVSLKASPLEWLAHSLLPYKWFIDFLRGYYKWFPSFVSFYSRKLAAHLRLALTNRSSSDCCFKLIFKFA